MIRRELTKALNQFKRVHESQIQHKVLIDRDVICRLRRHSLKQYTDSQLIGLSKTLIQKIHIAQQNLDTPHKGLNRFIEHLEQLTENK